MSLADGLMEMLKQFIKNCTFILLGAVTTVGVACSCAIWSDLKLQPYAVGQTVILGKARQIHVMQNNGFGVKQHTIADFRIFIDWVTGKSEEQRILEQRKIEEAIIAEGGVIVVSRVTNVVIGYHNLSETPFNVYWSQLGEQSHLDGEDSLVNQEFAAGWPMMAMWGSNALYVHNHNKAIQKDYVLSDKYILRTEEMLSSEIANSLDKPILPLRPIALGFACNTMLYASVWWIALAGIPKSRRHLRHVKGKCISCAYDLRGITSERCPECGIVANCT